MTKDHKKIYNERHDLIIEYGHSSVSKDGKEGEVVPHNRVVTEIYFFDRVGGKDYKRIELKREIILDLAKQIQEIESKLELLPFTPPLPF